MSLQSWENSGLLKKHKTSKQEIEQLFEVARRDLRDCKSPGLSADWRLNIAYNAALQLAKAALAASGYRIGRKGAHHQNTIESLAYTIGADRKFITKFDMFRKKRNQAGYDLAGATSNDEANEMIALAEELQDKVEIWITANHPEYR